jgi:LemA protein
VTKARAAAVAAQAGVGGAGGDAATLGVPGRRTCSPRRWKPVALAEGYPSLKANQNMLALQESSPRRENRIAFARQAYNDAVMAYNIKQTFPNNLIGGVTGFGPAALFEIEDPQERANPQVSF